jgi:hypothetical protein
VLKLAVSIEKQICQKLSKAENGIHQLVASAVPSNFSSAPASVSLKIHRYRQSKIQGFHELKVNFIRKLVENMRSSTNSINLHELFTTI